MQNCDEQILDKLTNIRENTEQMNIETNCRLTENTETNVRNMSGHNVRKMPVHQKCAKNAFRECPTNDWRPKMSKTCFQECPRHALSTNKSKKKIRTFLSKSHAWARFERYQKGHFKVCAHEHDLDLISEPKNKYYLFRLFHFNAGIAVKYLKSRWQIQEFQNCDEQMLDNLTSIQKFRKN